jgi:uncharacterized membrane protein
MNRLKEFVKSTVVGGLLVILPLAISFFILTWVFGLVQEAISPLKTIVMQKSPLQGVVADILAVALLIVVCFSVGVLVRIRLGKWLYSVLESNVFLKVPGYSLIKETVYQFLGKKKSPFSSVALVQIFDNETLLSAFITDEHADGTCTVFVPTGPNPTSGNIYHLPKDRVHPVDVSIEDAMRSIISCGAGSSILIAKKNRTSPTKRSS